MSGFGAKASFSPFGAKLVENGTKKNAFGAKPTGFGAKPSTFGAKPAAFGVKPAAFGVKPSAFDSSSINTVIIQQPVFEKKKAQKTIKTIELSSKGLKQINVSLFDNDFTFSFKGTEFKCPTFLAEFVSKKVSKLREHDPTVNSLDVDFEIKQDDTINKLEQLFKGKSFVIEEEKSNDNELVNLLINIGNEDAMDIKDKELCVGNAIEMLTYKNSLDFNTNNEIEFIAQHFEELKNKEIRSEFIPLILDSNKLRIESESSILDYVVEQAKKDKTNISLIKYIHCEFLSKGEDLEKYVNFIDSIDSTETVGSLWPSLRRRFTVNEVTNKERFRRKRIKFEVKNGSFNGIIKHLSNECSGNVVDRNVIKVSASSNSDNQGENIRNVVQEEGDWSTDETDENSCINFDFKDKNVLVNAYSLRSNSDECNFQPKSWCLEGSNDNTAWECIDERNDQELMHGALKEATFGCSEQDKCFRYLRIRGIGSPWGGDHCNLPINRVEFFGELEI